MERQIGLSSGMNLFGLVALGIIFLFLPPEPPLPSPLGDKIRNRRTELKLSLEKLAEQAEASKSYLWELENKDVPKPSADKLVKIAAALKVTPEFLLATDDMSPGNEVLDAAFFRKYKQLPDTDKKRLQRILDAWEDED